LTTVRFLQDIPEIVGVDLEIYGPFKKEDVASLPLSNAQALEKQGAVKAIEVKSVS
jgi:DNA replication factor GINS